MYKSKILLKYIFSEELDVKDLTEEKYNQIVINHTRKRRLQIT
ncbi:mepB family protein [Staphylococcus aureus]|nr:mepB family protein [Staphylococcus aureus]